MTPVSRAAGRRPRARVGRRVRLLAAAASLVVMVGCSSSVGGQPEATAATTLAPVSSPASVPVSPSIAPTSTDEPIPTTEPSSTEPSSPPPPSTVTLPPSSTVTVVVTPTPSPTLQPPTPPATPATSAGAAQELYQWQSPTKNIACLIGEGEVRCDINEVDFAPPKPADCSMGVPRAIVMAMNQPPRWVCISDTVASPESPVLEYGSSAHGGAFTCTSEEAGMTCRDDNSGHSFTLSRGSAELN